MDENPKRICNSNGVTIIIKIIKRKYLGGFIIHIYDLFKLTNIDKKIIIITFFVVGDLLSNILATKLFNVGFFGLVLDCGTLLFPLCYLLGDVITECYGEQTLIRTVILTTSANLLMVFITLLSTILPYPNYWTGQFAFEFIFNYTPRFVVLGLIAYFIGQWFNARLMTVLKEKYPKHLFVRTIGSTIGGEFIDTVIITFAYIGMMPLIEIIPYMLLMYAIKVLWEVVLQPITYTAVAYIQE